jgi:hypothetical protein
MSELDEKIREALRREDSELFGDPAGEPSMFDMILGSFRGRHRRIMMLSAFWILVFFVLGVIAAFQFFGADATRGMVLWATVFVFSVSTVSMLKVMYWMELNKNAVTREIKRLELQIARLANRMKD